MPSDLQRVAQGLVECLDRLPAMIGYLQRLAAQCRENASYLADFASGNPAARQAAYQLAAAADACERAAHLAAAAPSKARGWADQMVVGVRGIEPSAGVGQRDLPRDPSPAKPEATMIELSTTEPEHRKLLNQPPPRSTVKVDGRFVYETDGDGRVVRAKALLELVDLKHPRDTTSQRNLDDKLPGDHAGHIFARIFRGPIGKMNLTPMAGSSVNLSAYKKAENAWRAALEAGSKVEVQIDLVYRTDKNRPDLIAVKYSIDGVVTQQTIRNAPRSSRGSTHADS
ncbi:DNA/RNA non-specific endonuclease [Kribbella sp. NPDC000426]|uniref:DNA/RNA non-specific endonuclease n=1 Tax=Kribbella sp. NPDC000426 TaxID=3154255 RepID=UPI0033343E6B